MARIRIDVLQKNEELSRMVMLVIFGGPTPWVPPDPDIPRPDLSRQSYPMAVKGQLLNLSRDLSLETMRRESLQF